MILCSAATQTGTKQWEGIQKRENISHVPLAGNLGHKIHPFIQSLIRLHKQSSMWMSKALTWLNISSFEIDSWPYQVFIKMAVRAWRWETDLLSFCSADRQGVGYQQSCVLLLHYVDAGNWNHYLQENTATKSQEKSASISDLLNTNQYKSKNHQEREELP